MNFLLTNESLLIYLIILADCLPKYNQGNWCIKLKEIIYNYNNIEKKIFDYLFNYSIAITKSWYHIILIKKKWKLQFFYSKLSFEK